MLRSGAFRTRGATRNFFRSLAAVRAAHTRLYNEIPAITVTARPIVNTKESLRTCFIRVPFAYNDLWRLVNREITKLRRETGSQFIEHTVTCNIVLKDTVRNTYSVFYGGDFTASDDVRTLIAPPLTITEDFHPRDLSYDYSALDLNAFFDNIFFPKSGLNCVQIINYVVQLRTVA